MGGGHGWNDSGENHHPGSTLSCHFACDVLDHECTVSYSVIAYVLISYLYILDERIIQLNVVVSGRFFRAISRLLPANVAQGQMLRLIALFQSCLRRCSMSMLEKVKEPIS